MTLEPSRQPTPTVGESMSSAADSPAKTSALPERAPELTASVPGCGRNTPGSFAWFDRDSSSWKTFQLCLGGDWDVFSETWPRAGTTRNGIASRLPPLAPLTGATACFLLPTPTTNDAKNSTLPPSQRGRDSLVGHILRTGLLSTPTASRRGSYKTGRTGAKKGGCRNLSEDVAALGERGELNPPWVEWLMGFPIGWTDLGYSETP